ncbi:MAG: hypothetical protein WBQ44_19590 [Rhodococcus sp. (in: high G+C Gram-positive bacteria)]
MGRHSVNNAAPTREWIESVLGKRHRLTTFHNPSIELADRSALLRLFPTAADVDDYAHRDEAYRNLGTSAALHVVREVFADFDSYVLRLSEQRVREHRPLRASDVLHSDVFIETHDANDDVDIYNVRIVFTDTIGALVFTNYATFEGHLECSTVEKDEPVDTETTTEPERRGTGLAASS